MSDVDELDRAALERMWPSMKYGDPWPFAWFNRVGRTRQMRDGIKALRVGRGPRGIAIKSGRHIRCGSKLSGEFEAR